MKVLFGDSKLKRCALEPVFCVRTLGPMRAGIFNRRVRALLDVDNLSQTCFLPGRFHPLSSNRKGEWACSLDQPYRLIFRPSDRFAGQEADKVEEVEILSIEDYH